MCERYIDGLPLNLPPTRDLACNPGMCPDWELNPVTLWFAACAQPTGLRQPGLIMFLDIMYFDQVQNHDGTKIC